MTEPNTDLPEEVGPVGKPSQAEGDIGDSDSPGDSSSDQS
jgi:hypothetical protein